MSVKKVLPYQNVGTKENPLWEKYYTITSSEAVYVNEETKETLDNKLGSIDSNIENAKQGIGEKSTSSTITSSNLWSAIDEVFDKLTEKISTEDKLCILNVYSTDYTDSDGLVGIEEQIVDENLYLYMCQYTKVAGIVQLPLLPEGQNNVIWVPSNGELQKNHLYLLKFNSTVDETSDGEISVVGRTFTIISDSEFIPDDFVSEKQLDVAFKEKISSLSEKVSSIEATVNETNAKFDNYYDKVTTDAQIDTKIANSISSAYKAAGSINAENIPAPQKDEEGKVYNLLTELVTTDLFVEGAGNKYPAGSNIVCIDTGTEIYKWDVLSGFVDMSIYATTDYVDGKVNDINTEVNNLSENMVSINFSEEEPVSATSNSLWFKIE